MDTVDEITQARAALYQRVYLHSVTRTAEAVLARSIATIIEQDGSANLRDALSVWSMTDDVFLQSLFVEPCLREGNLGRRLLLRDMPKKACVFSTSLVGIHMPIEDIFPNLASSETLNLRRQVAHSPLEELSWRLLDGKRALKLEELIKDELDNLLEKLPPRYKHINVPKEPLSILVVIGTAYMDKVRKDAIVLQNGELLRTSQFTNVREQQDAFDIFKAVGYVMCDPAWRPLVMLASRSIIGRQLEPPLPTTLQFSIAETNTAPQSSTIEVNFVKRSILDLSGVIRRSAIKREEITTLMKTAEEGGYFDDKPYLATREDAGSQIISRISRIFETFEGVSSWRVRPNTVASFVGQFPPRLRMKLLRVLEQCVFFDRMQIRDTLTHGISGFSGGGDIVGLSPNSGQHMRMILEQELPDLRLRGWTYCRTINEALKRDTDEPLILVDDNISTATQFRAQLLSWANVPHAEWPVECQEEDGIFSEPFTVSELERFRTRPLKLIVCAGRDTADAAIIPVMAQIGVRNFSGTFCRHNVENYVVWDGELKDFLIQVGKSLIAWVRFRKNPEELVPDQLKYCEDRAFGYHNAGALLATANNVPTSTVTALWCPGLFRGSPWIPLLIRSNKLKHLVIG